MPDQGLYWLCTGASLWVAFRISNFHMVLHSRMWDLMNGKWFCFQELIKRHKAKFYFLPLGMMGASTQSHGRSGSTNTSHLFNLHVASSPSFHICSNPWPSPLMYSCLGSQLCWSPPLLGWRACSARVWRQLAGLHVETKTKPCQSYIHQINQYNYPSSF